MKWWRWLFTSSCVAVGTGVLGIFWKRLPPVVPVWYGRPWGDEQLARPWLLGLIPLMVLVLGIFQEVMVRKLKDKTLERILEWSIAGVQIILSIGLIRIVMLVS